MLRPPHINHDNHDHNNILLWRWIATNILPNLALHRSRLIKKNARPRPDTDRFRPTQQTDTAWLRQVTAYIIGSRALSCTSCPCITDSLYVTQSFVHVRNQPSSAIPEYWSAYQTHNLKIASPTNHQVPWQKCRIASSTSWRVSRYIKDQPGSARNTPCRYLLRKLWGMQLHILSQNHQWLPIEG